MVVGGPKVSRWGGLYCDSGGDSGNMVGGVGLAKVEGGN
jgi:hypothetical protein